MQHMMLKEHGLCQKISPRVSIDYEMLPRNGHFCRARPPVQGTMLVQ